VKVIGRTYRGGMSSERSWHGPRRPNNYCHLTNTRLFDFVLFECLQWRSKVEVGPCAMIPKGPPRPLYRFVCSANKQSPYSGNFWVGLIGLKFVIQAKVKDFRLFQTKPTTADLCYTLSTTTQEKIFFLNKQNG